VWPGLAPLMVLPLIMLLPDAGDGPRAAGGMGVLFGATYLSLVPIMALDMLTMSQHWQAADLFRIAPVPGPAALSRGARRAVLALVALPALLVFAVLALVIGQNVADLVLLIPGLLALPVLAMVPCLGGGAVPLSQPP